MTRVGVMTPAAMPGRLDAMPGVAETLDVVAEPEPPATADVLLEFSEPHAFKTKHRATHKTNG